MEKRILVTGVGSYVPSQVLSTEDIVNMRPGSITPNDWVDLEWVRSRTGIETRHIAPPGWASSDLMVEAAKNALADGGVTIDDIDLIVCSTSFPDQGFNVPRTAEIFKDKIGAPQSTLSVGEDAACAGFCWAMERARMEMLMNGFKRALVVSGDKVTSAVNYRDRNTCILFGDAGGAVVLEAKSLFGGIIHSIRETDSRYRRGIEISAGGSALPMTHELLALEAQFMTMPGGRDMLRIISGEIIPRFYQEMDKYSALARIKYIIPHQANLRLLDAAEKRTNCAEGVMFKDNVACFGNTSGSSVPLALDTLYRQGKLSPDDVIMLIGFGAGFIYGANLIRWTKPQYSI